MALHPSENVRKLLFCSLREPLAHIIPKMAAIRWRQLFVHYSQGWLAYLVSVKKERKSCAREEQDGYFNVCLLGELNNFLREIMVKIEVLVF